MDTKQHAAKKQHWKLAAKIESKCVDLDTEHLSFDLGECAQLLADAQAAEAERVRRETLELGNELNQCLQIIVINAGNIKCHTEGDERLGARRIEKAVERASKAIRGMFPPKQYFEADAELTAVQMSASGTDSQAAPTAKGNQRTIRTAEGNKVSGATSAAKRGDAN